MVSWPAARGQTAPQPPAEPASPTPRAFESRSRQFLVQAVAVPALSPLISELETNPDFIQLNPILLPVSCDRIKQSLCRQLGADTSWRGRIYVGLQPAESTDDPITIASERFRDGWQYFVALPSVVERSRYVHAMVQVLLLEMANRGATDRSAELPPWLSEGFSRQLLASTNGELDVILPNPQVAASGLRVAWTTVSARRANPLEEAHKWLSAASPLTFQELSWPTPDQLSGEAGAVYGSSAQLFVSELLRLPDGPGCLRAMLADLPRRYNWQLSFLQAFQSRFQRPLDVEKWWALQVLHFTGRELTQTWPPDESWQKLDEVVRSAVQVHVGTNDLPLQAEVKLQTIIRQWDSSRQTQTLQEKIRELDALRLRVAPEVAPLTAQYRQVLATYLQIRDRGGSVFGLGKKAAHRRAAEEVLLQLDALDAQRASQRPEAKPAGPVKAAYPQSS
ncbi:MAG TPA: hypothetical protein VNZ64_18145 [Candidatus Acidoferrum sp.]|nr:hypothetical protein [Candidatus Acidoferrum sp.]